MVGLSLVENLKFIIEINMQSAQYTTIVLQHTMPSVEM